MKKFLTLSIATFTLTFIFTLVRADEGMWLPILLKQLNESDMQSKGLKLSAEDIYSVNKTSLKDAVVLFGGGCTGELISDQGLLITNHHCGFSNISALSTIEHNYLKDGYWSKSKEEEFPCPGLTVTFIISMQNVTDKILPNLDNSLTEPQRNALIRQLASALEKDAIKGTHYDAAVKSFYYGTEFYLFTTETFKDIRFVGAPPNSVGDFGGETDNWVYPRHTGDFSLFRIYADADNNPAAYSKDNKPFKPRYFFPISLKGVKDGDFTMVYGFPGTTTEYLPSAAIDLIMNVVDPNRVKIRDARIAIIDDYMHGNDTIRLMYASKTRRLANAYKKWKGEMTGLKESDVLSKKRKEEEGFQLWTEKNADGKNYQNLLNNFKQLYDQFKPLSKISDFTAEAVFGIELIKYAEIYKKLMKLSSAESTADSTLKTEADKLIKSSEGFFKNYHVPIDKKEFATLLKLYNDSVDKDIQPAYFKEQVAHYNGDFTKWADEIFKKSFMSNMDGVKKTLTDFNKKKSKKILNDPAWKLYDAMSTSMDEINTTQISALNEKIAKMQRDYMIALRKMMPQKTFYPDANSTLRVTYGAVGGYFPRNGVKYVSSTTADGIIEKYIPGDDDFDAPKPLLDLIAKHDFGRYANAEGQLPVNFIAANHTTGGNSGSPVLNSNGELIGINFDRVWEGTMSDVEYDVNRCRNISVDIRYTLFIIDKFGGAKNLIDEMKVVE